MIQADLFCRFLEGEDTGKSGTCYIDGSALYSTAGRKGQRKVQLLAVRGAGGPEYDGLLAHSRELTSVAARQRNDLRVCIQRGGTADRWESLPFTALSQVYPEWHTEGVLVGEKFQHRRHHRTQYQSEHVSRQLLFNGARTQAYLLEYEPSVRVLPLSEAEVAHLWIAGENWEVDREHTRRYESAVHFAVPEQVIARLDFAQAKVLVHECVGEGGWHAFDGTYAASEHLKQVMEQYDRACVGEALDLDARKRLDITYYVNLRVH